MANKYVLVNPYISGEFESTIKANNSNEAAKMFYNSISEHFNNAVPKFYFSIQKGGSGTGKYYHYRSIEKRKKDDVSFLIKPYTIKGENMTSFEKRLTQFKQKDIQNGGKKHSKKHSKDSSDSDSSSESDSEIFSVSQTYIPSFNQPIYYWWYDPLVYNLKSFYIPTFYSYVTPIIEISMY